MEEIRERGVVERGVVEKEERVGRLGDSTETTRRMSHRGQDGFQFTHHAPMEVDLSCKLLSLHVHTVKRLACESVLVKQQHMQPTGSRVV